MHTTDEPTYFLNENSALSLESSVNLNHTSLLFLHSSLLSLLPEKIDSFLKIVLL